MVKQGTHTDVVHCLKQFLTLGLVVWSVMLSFFPKGVEIKITLMCKLESLSSAGL